MLQVLEQIPLQPVGEDHNGASDIGPQITLQPMDDPIPEQGKEEGMAEGTVAE